jgi:aspartate/glutamate racemase
MDLYEKVACRLLGMEQDFCRDRLAAHGLTVLVPDAADLAIFEELCRGVVSDALRVAHTGVIALLVDREAPGVILGCTEVELLIGPQDSAVHEPAVQAAGRAAPRDGSASMATARGALRPAGPRSRCG